MAFLNPKPLPPSPLILFWIFLGIMNWVGCLFDAKLPKAPEKRTSSVAVDSIYPASAVPNRTIELYQPLLDPSLAPGKSSTMESFPAVNIKESLSGEIIRYHLVRQRFGTWSPTLEFKWNYFLLQVNFLFSTKIPDTLGMQEKTKALYDSIHGEDLFTNYFDSAATPEILNRINTSTKPGAIGIAVKLRPSGDTLEIQQVVKNSPASQAGLAVGMAILKVNDSTVYGDSAMERFQRFSVGDSGDVVVVTYQGPQGIATATMIRQPVAFPTVLADSLAANVGYISVVGFTPNTVGSKSTYTEFREALSATKKFPVTILDLRDNGGGSLDIAINMVDEILPAGTTIIQQRQRIYDEDRRVALSYQITSLATSGGIGELSPGGGRRKYLLLANSHSASASEILLVAIKEGAQAPLMGTRTYGKGVGQTVRATPGQGLALVTILKFTSAAHLDYHKRGLEPDYPDSSGADSLLIHATQRAQALIGQPAAKRSALSQSIHARELAQRAATIEWNRRQTFRPMESGFD